MSTICDKHDEIYDLALRIKSIIPDAKDDGQRMENALKKYKDEISRLEDELSDVEYEKDRIDALYEECKEELKESRTQNVSLRNTIEELWAKIDQLQ
jgi:chromosome segregation ATPase